VNMFGLRFFNELANFTKKGHAAQRHTGVASANSAIARPPGDKNRDEGAPGSMSPIAMMNSGPVKATATENRRDMSRSSASLVSCPGENALGSSAMPQIGQPPGCGRTTSGCMGQVHSMAEKYML